MAVLETIRVKFGVLITVLIAVALLSFIVDFNSLTSAVQTTSSKYSVGEINGKKISYKDFQEQVEYNTTIAELTGGSSVTTEEQQQQIRNAAWQHFIDRNLFLKEAYNAGITIGPAEMSNLTIGDDISPVLRYNAMFADASGNVDVSRIKEFVNTVGEDQSGNSKLYWNYLQDNILIQQNYAKYGTLFSAASIHSTLSLADALDANNVSRSFKYVTVPFGYEKDSTISVSSSEISAYYKAHKEQYRQVANRDIVYALIEVEPSDDDRDIARKGVEDAYDEFVSTDNLKSFLMRNSERALDEYYYKPGELVTVSPEVDDFVFSGKNGKVSPVIKDGDSYMAVRIVESRNLPDSVFVRHILIQGDNHLADSLFGVIKKQHSQFAALASIYSADKNPNVAQPGDLGWMTQTMMLPGMESVLTAKLNKPFILDTRYGRHIVEVTKATKANAKKKVAILSKTAFPSVATMNTYYSKANALATAAAGKVEGLESAAKEQNIYLMPLNVTEATSQYSSVSHAKEVTRWIFEAKKGSASNVISVNQNYLFVVGVKEIHKEGYASVKEVSSRIENILYRQKYAEKALGEVKAKTEGCTDIESAAKALGTNVETMENVTFASGNYLTIEPALIGAAAGMEQGKLSRPVKGERGIYLVEVTDSIEGEFYTKDDADAMQAQKTQYSMQQIVPALMQSTGSVDHRERFF